MPPPQTVRHVDTSVWNISPTTITDPDLQTPTSDRDAQYYETVRCVCNGRVSDNEQLMIQW